MPNIFYILYGLNIFCLLVMVLMLTSISKQINFLQTSRIKYIEEDILYIKTYLSIMGDKKDEL